MNVPNTGKTAIDFAFGVHTRKYHDDIVAANITFCVFGPNSKRTKDEQLPTDHCMKS